MLYALPRDTVTVTLTPRAALHAFVEGVELDDTTARRPWRTTHLPPHVRAWLRTRMATAPTDTVVIITDCGRAPMIGTVVDSTRFHWT